MGAGASSAGASERVEKSIGPAARRSSALLAIGMLVSSVGGAVDPEATRTVLLLNSFGHLQPVTVEGDRGFLQTVRSTADRPLAIFNEALDAPRFAGEAYEATVTTYLVEKYRSRPPDVVVAQGHEALLFLLRHRSTIAPGVSVVHAGVANEFLRGLEPLPADVVGIPVAYDFAPTLDLALRLHPRARRLVMVTGTTDLDRRFEAALRAEAARVADRAAVDLLAGLPASEVMERLAALPRDAVVFTPGFLRDGDGREFNVRESVAAMTAASAAPVYSAFSTLLDTGIVGGYMVTFEEVGRRTGEVVNQLLADAGPQSLQLPKLMPQTLHLDWRQLRRWGVDERAVPDGAVMHFREPTLLEAYRREVAVSGAVMVVQAALIGLLLIERRRRRRAELAERVQRLQLAHASRLAVAGELAASIAHEINQPLGAILSNADAADMMLETGSVQRDELRTILADIRRDDRRASEVIRRLRGLLAKHELDRRPFDLNDVLGDTQSMLTGEARRRRVDLRVRPAPGPLDLVGDPIQVQQVLINLVLNAMDAVAELPDERRAVVVKTESLANGAAFEVRVPGPGIPREHVPRLFDSFFTTKPTGMGLGLPIARTLVQAHGGSILVESTPGSGTTFRVELPADGGGGGAWTERG